MKQSRIRLALLAPLLLSSAAHAQWTTPGQTTVPLWTCQLSATQLESAVGLASCVSASFTGSAGSGAAANQLTTTSVTGIIKAGQAVSGTGITAGTTIVSQISGTPGGAGVYLLSTTSTSSSASLTSGGIPPNATTAALQAETANVRYRDDGGAPTSGIGVILVSGATPMPYNGTLSALQFIAATGSPLLDIAFYRQ